MRTLRARELLGREVRYRDIRLGVLVDVLLDPTAERVVGFDVRCGDERRRFVPFSVAEPVDGTLDVPSALVLVEDQFYRERSRSISTLAGTTVRRSGRALGDLVEVAVDADTGAVVFVVAANGEEVEVRAGAGVSLVAKSPRRPV